MAARGHDLVNGPALVGEVGEARRLYWAGLPEARIARYFRVNRKVVRRIIRELGLLPRSYFDSNRFLAS